MDVRGLIAFALTGLFACGSSPKPVVTAAEVPPGGDVSATSTGEQDGPIEFAPPSKQACMLHQEAGAHFLCLSGADGQCFHYGSVCVPTDACVLELSTGQLKACKDFSEGACVEFGETCTPKTNCLYDTKQRRYRTCDEVKPGKCGRFSAVCDPATL